MRKSSLFVPLAFLFLLTLACQGPLSMVDTPTPESLQLPPRPTAEAYLAAWEQGDYATMYGLLSPSASQTMTEEEFTWFHQSIMEEATVVSVDLEITNLTEETGEALVDFTLTLNTILLGSAQIENHLPLVWDDTGWRVDWSPEVILPGMTKDNLVYLQRLVSTRGNIYASDGEPLATEGSRVTVGVVPKDIEDEYLLLAELSRILGLSQEYIRSLYTKPGTQPYWFVPIADISFEASLTHADALNAIPGVMLQESSIRTYPQGAVAAHVVGYLGEIDQEELAVLEGQGYIEGDPIGRAGLERWAETYLAGGRGGRLTIVTPGGELVDTIAERPATQSSSIYTSIDLQLQKVAEEALGEHRGAVVALDPNNGEILAMASSPGYDPNEITFGRFDPARWDTLSSDPERPLLNRATQGAYPTGSIFKIVTAAAAMEGAGFPPSTTVNCKGSWAGLGPGWVKTDWLRSGHGPVDFRSAITRSCDVFFFEMGFRLNSIDPDLLPRYGHYFGFGELTGLDSLDETPGLVPDPEWKEKYFTGEGNPFWVPGDAVNLAVGQGDLLATPLQVANMMAAIANGGILYQPHLVTRISAVPGEQERVFKPTERGRLPLSETPLQVLRDGLQGVTMNPEGTAHYAFEDAPFTSAGKTGTAETPEEKPHAWFAGYAPAEAPQIAVAVVVENSGEGSVFAAPICRKVMEAYLFGPPAEQPEEGTEEQ